MATSQRQKKDGSSTSTAALVVTLDALPVSGNTLVVAVANQNGFVSSISGGGVTWASAVIRSGSHIPTEIWSGVVTGTPAAAITINITLGAIAAKVMEWSGRLTADQTASATAISATLDPTAITPTANDTLVIAAGGANGSITAGPTGGFTDETTVTPGSVLWTAVGSLLEGDRAAADTTWTTTGVAWDAVIASFTVAQPGQYRPVRIANRNVGPQSMRHRFHQPYTFPTPPAGFDPANGFPWNPDSDEQYVQPQSWPDPTTDLLMAFGPPLNAVAAQAFAVEGGEQQAQPGDDPSIQSWPVGPPLNAVSAPVLAIEGGEEFVASQFVADDTPGDPGLYPPATTAWAVDGGEVQAVPDDDPSVQSWAVGPPQNAVRATAFAVDGGEVQAQPDEDPSVQAWAVRPPLNATQAQAFSVDNDNAYVADQLVADDTPASLGLAPAAPFDPATGFPWDANGTDAPTVPQDVPEPDLAVAFGATQFDPQYGTAWQQDEAERFVDARLATDETAQSFPIQPPVAAVTRLTAFAVEGGEVQAEPTLDHSIQSWPVGPPQNATQALAFNQPDEAREVPVEDPTVPALVIQPPAYAPVFQSTAWAVDGGEQQAVPTEDPSVQAWAIGPSQNADRLTAWNPDRQLADEAPAADDTAQAWTIQPPFNPATVPWTTTPDEAAFEPTLDHSTQSWAVQPPAFDPASVSWVGRDVVIQPVWSVDDGTVQSWPIGPPPGVFNQPDEPIAPPAWLIVDVSNPWTTTLGIVTGGRGPDSGGATAATPGGWAVAPTPAGGASASLPGGSANNPRPGR